MAPQTMKAALLKKLNHPIVIEEVPVPKPTGRQVLVRVKAASLCHSDVHIIDGEMAGTSFSPSEFPVIIGHEAVSIAEELGPDAASYGIEVGDILGGSLYDSPCLVCRACRNHGHHFCPTVDYKGITTAGFFAEYTLVDAACAVIIAKAGIQLPVQLARLAPMFCAGVTVWDALERAEVKASDTIAIVGAGGLGRLACQFAHAMGATVFALDVRDETLKEVADIVDQTINTANLSDKELVAEILKLNHDKLVDTVIVTSGVVAAYTKALPIIDVGGRLVAVGLPGTTVPIHPGQLVDKCISIRGAKIPSKNGSEKGFNFVLRKGLYPKINPTKFKLEDINDMIDLMRTGKIEEGRMVVQFPE